jgi:hypothetical protein
MNKGYLEFLLANLDLLLKNLKNRKLLKILEFYKPILVKQLKDKEKHFTEPLIPHYIMYGMFLLSRQK